MESLSTFYGPQNNTVESRRSLRAGIEAEGLRLADSFITAFRGLEDVSGLSATTWSRLPLSVNLVLTMWLARCAQRFNKLYSQIEELDEGCARVSGRLQQTDARTADFLATTQRMQSKRYVSVGTVGPSLSPSSLK